MEKCGLYRAGNGVAPIWHKGYGLIWIDASARKIITFNPTSKKEQVFEALGWLKAIVPLEDGRFIGVYKDGLYFLNFKKGVRTPFTIFDNANDMYYLNDAKCGPDDKLWVSLTDGFYKRFKESPHTALSQYPFENAKLFSVEASGKFEKRIEKIMLVNGFDWDRRTNKFYYIDPLKYEIYQYQLTEDEELQFEKVVYAFHKDDGFPNSMTIDAEGNIWIPMTKEVTPSDKSEKCTRMVCINPSTMETIVEFEIPVSYITSCVIGGEDYKTLFITTSYDQLPLEKVKYEPFAGYLIAIPIEQQGVPHYEFAASISNPKQVF